MTPTAQRIAIAESVASHHPCCRCGAPATGLFGLGAFLCSERCAKSIGDFALDDGQQALPDYLGCLNEMHAVESKLTGAQCLEYVEEINEATKHMRHITIFPMIHATAAQRAEAYLRCIGKWQDGSATGGTSTKFIEAPKKRRKK